jgi:hypothetical protein
MRRLLVMAHQRPHNNGSIVVCYSISLLRIADGHVRSTHPTQLTHRYSLVLVMISISYSYLLHYISQQDFRLAYSLQAAANPASRRESMAVGLGRRESLIPPVPNGYSTIEPSGNRLGVYALVPNLCHLRADGAYRTRLSHQTRLIRAALYAVSFWVCHQCSLDAS